MQVLAEHLNQPVLFDLSNCKLLTDKSTLYFTRLKSIRILNLDNCPLLTDEGLDQISELYASLEVLSIANNKNVTDDGLMPIASSCKLLTTLNINLCINITHEILTTVARNCRGLQTLHVSGIQISDHGLERISHFLSNKNFTSLDVSFCYGITDHGLIAVAEKCSQLTYFNGCGLHRVTDVGAQTICRHWWKLKYLNLEDMFLMKDSAFWFDRMLDGRQAADENMLKSLTSLNLSDCIHITDHAIEGIALRCKHLEQLRLKGCDRITDKALSFLTEPPLNFGTNEKVYPATDKLKLVDLSYCKQLTPSAIVTFLSNCPILENLNISGIVGVTDDVILHVCQTCPALQHIALQRCVALTDATLCHLAEFLWVEYLDISYCNRVTDDGIDVFTVACSGIQTLIMKRLLKISTKAIKSLARNCKGLRRLDVSECVQYNDVRGDFDQLINMWPHLKISF